MDSPRTRIAALDGWRGIAILMVMFDHWQGQWFGGLLAPWSQTGSHGVSFFFVLSGYLITTNLLHSPDLKSFYIRRFFRLQPVAWAYLAFLLLLGQLFPRQALRWDDLASCLLFFRNYIPHESHFFSTAHFWSLSIEEQFYITWPALLLTLKPRRPAWIAGGIALLVAVYRAAHFATYNSMWMSFRTEVRVDAICIGCVLAISLESPTIVSGLTRLLKWIYAPAVVTLFLCIKLTHNLPSIFECIAYAVLISDPILRPTSLPSRILAARPLAWLGTISYSVYVWQNFFLRHYSAGADIFLDCLLLPAAAASYYLIERRMIQLGRQVGSSKRSKGREIIYRTTTAGGFTREQLD